MVKILFSRYAQEDLDEISRIVHRDNSIVALLTEDIKDVSYYLHPYPLRHCTALLDRNVYTRITALTRGDPIPVHAIEDHKWAAAIMAFCQIARIKFDYGSSLQEYASQRGGESALHDLQQFYIADNCDPLAWIDFAVGRAQSLDIRLAENVPPLTDIPTAGKLEASIYEYRVNYISALKIATLSAKQAPPERLMLELIEWMDVEFVLGSAALHFANLLFSPSRFKGMLKRRTLKDVRNIAWDFALVQIWRQRVFRSLPKTEPILLITRDKVVRFIAERLAGSELNDLKGFIVDPWKSAKNKGEAIFQRYLELNQHIKENPESRRARKLAMNLDEITKKYEEEFLLSIGTEK